jgi:cytochrome c oxidase subunit 2
MFMLFLPLKITFSDLGQGDHHTTKAQAHPVISDTGGGIAPSSAGESAYELCSSCHGADGEGNAALNAPALAGQEPWHLKRQIQKFKDGVRGTHVDDIYGMQMRPMAMALQSDEQTNAVIEYIANMSPVKPADTLGGDADKGQAGYALCQTCHGANAEGIEAMNAPSLLGLPDWYIVTQLKNYKAGIRGYHAKDIEGMQMAPIAKAIADEAAMADLAAYINSKAAAK